MRNDPPRKKQGRPISSEKPNQENEPTTTIMNLDDASLGTILEFVANVNRRFRFLYHHAPNTIYGAVEWLLQQHELLCTPSRPFFADQSVRQGVSGSFIRIVFC